MSGNIIKQSLNKAKEKIEKTGITVDENKSRKSGKSAKGVNAECDFDSNDKVHDGENNQNEVEHEWIDRYSVLKLKGVKMKLIIPGGFEPIKEKKIIDTVRNAFGLKHKPEESYINKTSNSINTVVFFYPKKEEVMDFENIDGIINGIHECLAENQGLIEAKVGKTRRGYKYVYSIVKSVGGDNILGVRYFLRIDFEHSGKIVEANGSFEEIGTTGIRESMAACLANNAGIYKMGSDGWNEDPYNPEYKKGNLKNLAEKEGLDGLFPDNPLSKTREFLAAVLNDEILTDQDEGNNKDMMSLFVDECLRSRRIVEVEPKADEDKKASKEKLDDRLREAIDGYNAQYALMSDKGSRLYTLRERSVDLVNNVENLINSIANHPKEFDKYIDEIVTSRDLFTNTCEYAKNELEAAQKSAISAGAGIAGGAAIASLTPSVAMWIATTFGTASTGTAISALSGAAATNAALAWLGGGALAAGGGGMAAGNAFLAMAGPVGWGVAGATLLASIVLFANKKVKIGKQKKEEIESVIANTEKIKEIDIKIKEILDKTESLRDSTNNMYNACLMAYGKNYTELSQDCQYQLGALVNITKSLSSTFGEGV